MAERDYTGDMPVEAPEGIVQWLRSRGKLSTELLIYKMGAYIDPLTEQKVSAVKLTCTACGGEVFTGKIDAGGCGASYAPARYGFAHPGTGESLISGNHCLCPECGKQVRVIHTGNVGYSCDGIEVDECYPMTVGRIDDKLLLVGWRVTKNITKDGCTTYAALGYEAYVIENNVVVRLNAFRSNFGGPAYHLGKWEQRKRFDDRWGLTELVYPWDAGLLNGSTAENSKLDALMNATAKAGTYPVSYLRLWQMRPQAENLVVQGASELLTSIIGEKLEHGRNVSRNMDPIDWSQTSPSKMLGMNKDQFRTCVLSKWSREDLAFWMREKQRGRELTPAEMSLAADIGYFDCSRMRDMGADWMQASRYLQKQKAKDKRADTTILFDYWNIAGQIGEDLSVPSVRFPPRLMPAHDRAVEGRKWKEEAKRAEERMAREELFEERYMALKKLYWRDSDMFIRPVRDEKELVSEGEALSHCVGSYAKAHATGDKALFVIRRNQYPLIPWFTLELDEEKLSVRQNRGHRNSAPPPEVEAFVRGWIAHLREERAAMKGKRKKATKVA